MNKYLPAKRVPKDTPFDEENKRVCTGHTRSSMTNSPMESSNEIQSNMDQVVTAVTTTFNDLVLGNLQPGKKYTIKMNDQVLLSPRPLPEGVTPTGELTSTELNQALLPYYKSTDMVNKITITKTEKQGYETFDDELDSHLDKKPSILNHEVDDALNSVGNIANNKITGEHVELPYVIVDDNQVTEIPSFEFDESASYSIPIEMKHLTMQIKNSGFQLRSFSQMGKRRTEWETVPQKVQILLNYVKEIPQKFINYTSLKIYLKKHCPGELKNLSAANNVINRWIQNDRYGLNSRFREEMTDAERSFIVTGQGRFLRKFYEYEKTEEIDEIREGVLFCIIDNFALIQDTINLSASNLSNHPMKSGNMTNVEVFRKVVFLKRKDVGDLLWNGKFS